MQWAFRFLFVPFGAFGQCKIFLPKCEGDAGCADLQHGLVPAPAAGPQVDFHSICGCKRSLHLFVAAQAQFIPCGGWLTAFSETQTQTSQTFSFLFGPGPPISCSRCKDPTGHIGSGEMTLRGV